MLTLNFQGLSPSGTHHRMRREKVNGNSSDNDEDSKMESDNPNTFVENGLPKQMRTDYPISRCWNGSQETLVYYVEMACNNMFGSGKEDMISKC